MEENKQTSEELQGTTVEEVVNPLEEETVEEVVAEDNPQDVIEKLQAEIIEKNDAFLRAKAETENIRRRAVEERVRAQKFAIEAFAQDVLPVIDALDLSLQNEEVTLENLLEGVEMTQKLFQSAISKNNLQEITCEDGKFDPNLHSAISTEESELEAGSIVRVLQKGYKLNKRTIRPTMVIVAKKKEE